MNQGRKKGRQEERNGKGRRTKAIKGQEGVTLWSDFPLLTIQACDVFIRLSLVILCSLLPILAFLHPFFLYYLFLEEPFIYFTPSVEILFGFWIFLWTLLSTLRLFPGSSGQAACGPSLGVDSKEP